MPTPQDKHGEAAKRIFYPSFDGGLNYSVPNESLPKNELKEALNVEFSSKTGAMTVRGGLVWSSGFEYDIVDVVPVPGDKGFLVRTRNSTGGEKVFYYVWNYVWEVDGLFSGFNYPSIVKWDDYYIVASGGQLQKFTPTLSPTLEDIANAPVSYCNHVFTRDGRVGCVFKSDTIMFSATGDCTRWPTVDIKTEEVSINTGEGNGGPQFVEIGYHDGMDIDAIVPLSQDLIIFKSPHGESVAYGKKSTKSEPDKGTIFRLTGQFPDWQVLEVAHNTGTFNSRSVQVVGNDIFYLTVAGLATLSNVTAYGDVKTAWPDRKVSSVLTPLLDKTAQLWNIPVKQQLWVIPSLDTKGLSETALELKKQIWVLDYTKGVWTKFKFPEIPTYAIGIDDRLFIFIGRDMYELKDNYTQDDMKDDSSDTGTTKKDIEAIMVLGSLLNGWQTLIKGVFASFYIMPGCEAKLMLKKFSLPFESNIDPDYIYDPPNSTVDYAYTDDDPLFQEGGVMTARRRCVVRDWAIMPEIRFKGGCSSVSTIGLEVVEV